MNYHAKNTITNQGININDPYYTTVVIVLHNVGNFRGWWN